jgi:hypothetical protein
MPQADADFRRIPPGECHPVLTIVDLTFSQWMNRQDRRREEKASSISKS